MSPIIRSLLFSHKALGEMMLELGKKDDCVGVELLVPITTIRGRPEKLPTIPEGSNVICSYDQGLGERLFLCESLEDM